MVERKLIGIVGVDSGQLMIADPCYIKNKWKNEGDILGVKFWGEGEKELKEILVEKGYVVIETYTGACFIHEREKEKANDLRMLIELESRRIQKKVVSKFQTSSSYDQVSQLTLSKDQAGQFGLGVAFSSGLGDGFYEVYATYKDTKDWGRCITKVEIELIPDSFSEEEE